MKQIKYVICIQTIQESYISKRFLKNCFVQRNKKLIQNISNTWFIISTEEEKRYIKHLVLWKFLKTIRDFILTFRNMKFKQCTPIYGTYIIIDFPYLFYKTCCKFYVFIKGKLLCLWLLCLNDYSLNILLSEVKVLEFSQKKLELSVVFYF